MRTSRDNPPAAIARSRAFTLVEMLVVISVVTLLISMLLPALGKSKRAARAVICLSNQRNLQQAQVVYCDNNVGRTKNLSHALGEYWHHSIASYLGDDRYRANPNQNQWQYAPMSVLTCPETQKPPIGGPGTVEHLWNWGGGGQAAYGANLWVFPKYAEYDSDPIFPRSDFFSSWQDISRSSSVPLFGDSNWVGGWPDDVDIPAPNLYTGLFVHNYGTFMGRWTIDRHDRGINLVFVDGSGRKVSLEGLWQLQWHKTFQPTVVVVP